MSERDKQTYDYVGKQFAKSPEYAKKQFKVKEGMSSKIPKAKKKK